VHASVLAKQVELSFPNYVNWIWNGEVVLKVFILYLELFNVVHVDSDDSTDGGVVEGRDSPLEFSIEGPGFSTVECHVGGKGKEYEML
jgi:hypothetical protein